MDEAKDKSQDAGQEPQVPAAVVSRMSLYLRELQQLVRTGLETTNSTQLGQKLGFTDAQVRKDLAYFGQFGRPGIGYRCEELIPAIQGILGTDRSWPVAVVGLGNLGRALLGYRGFDDQGFRVVAAFDVETDKLDQDIAGIDVFHFDRLSDVVADKSIRLGIIAVPATAAQKVASKLVAAGVEGILNFAPITLSLPNHVSRVGVDLAIELEQLSFAVVNRLENS